jgi:hypothetical protein
VRWSPSSVHAPACPLGSFHCVCSALFAMSPSAAHAAPPCPPRLLHHARPALSAMSPSIAHPVHPCPPFLLHCARPALSAMSPSITHAVHPARHASFIAHAVHPARHASFIAHALLCPPCRLPSRTLSTLPATPPSSRTPCSVRHVAFHHARRPPLAAIPPSLRTPCSARYASFIAHTLHSPLCPSIAHAPFTPLC